MTEPEHPPSAPVNFPFFSFQVRLTRIQLLALVLAPLVIWLLWRLWVVAAILFLALLVAIGLSPIVSRIDRRGFSRVQGTLILYAGILLGLAGLFYLVGRVLMEQLESFLIALPDLLIQWQQALEGLFPAGNFSFLPDWIAGFSLALGNIASLVLQGVLALLLVLLISFYLLTDGPRLWDASLRVIPKTHRQMSDVLGLEIARRLRGYLRGVGLSGLIVGIFTTIGLLILDVPYAILFGVLAGLLEAIPVVGPLLAAIGPIALALAQSPGQALLVAVLFIAIQQIEDKLLIPRIQSQTTGLHPLVVIVAVLVLGSVFGFLGILLAVPLVAAAQAVTVCLGSCFAHPEGAEAWLAARRSAPRDERSIEAELARASADVAG